MSKGRYCAAPAGKAALHKLILRLKRPGTNDTFVVRVARMGMLNAFTVPGQRIIISKKLLDFADTPDELAGVLAHEMGHALELHPEASIVRTLGISALGALLFGQSSNMESLAAIMLQLAYSRQAERQADDWALRLLRQAKISPRGFAAFFTKMKKKFRDTSGFLGAFSTHPATAERIKHIRNAGTWPATPALDEADWKALKAICGKS
jgi:predicted Zn-dependent protease